jgi:hypothetical protein
MGSPGASEGGRNWLEEIQVDVIPRSEMRYRKKKTIVYE